MAASATTTRRRPQHLISPASSATDGSSSLSPLLLSPASLSPSGITSPGNTTATTHHEYFSSPRTTFGTPAPRRRKSWRSYSKNKKRILSGLAYVIPGAAGFLLLVYSALHHSYYNQMSNATLVRHMRHDHPNMIPLPPPVLDNNATQLYHRQQPQHAIPHILIFTHRWNLLDDDHALDLKATIDDPDERAEVQVLRDNVRQIIALHPGATVRFLTDDDCLASLRAVLAARLGSDSTNNNQTNAAFRLLQHFQNEPVGMFKADLCRGAALYETGGVYLDVDLGVRMNLWDVLERQTEFATVRVHKQSKYPGAFFQAFTAATPHHAVLLRYVQLFGDYYEGRLPEIKKGPLGVLLLKRAYDEIEAEQQQQQHAQAPVSSKDHALRALVANDESSSATTNNTTITTHLNATTELWQEVLYVPELQHTLLRDIPPPVWGTRRACKFIVLARRTLPVVVPFYSRIAGSRMCPHNNNNNNAPRDDKNKNKENGNNNKGGEDAFIEVSDTGEEEDKR